MGPRMEYNGTTYVGALADELGEIRFAFCDGCQSVSVGSWDAGRRRRSWAILYMDPKTLEAPRLARASSARPARLRRAFGLPAGTYL